MFRQLVAILLSFVMLPLSANAGVYDNDSVVSEPHKSLFSKIKAYFDDSNKPKPYKPIDFSIIGGPFYSNDTKLGIGLVGAAQYHADPTDSISQPSVASIRGQVSTSLYYSIAIIGTHFFPGDRYRLNYNLKFSSFPTWFWGIGYGAGADNSTKTRYKDMRFVFHSNFLTEAARSFYVGPLFELDYIMAKDISSSEVWDGLPETTTSVALGFTLQYDTRDVISAPSEGWNLEATQRFYPVVLGNSSHSFSSTRLLASRYLPVWKGGVVATSLKALFTYGKTPWGMLATIGGPVTMRGYYEGRYRDKCAADITVELRQHVWKRSGIVVWVGAGTVFPEFSALRWKHVLPNAGVGYRWEFKKDVNVRVDVGFGRGEWGVEFNINEAF